MSSEPDAPLRHLRRDGETELAYVFQPGSGPPVVFLGGFTSDMTGTKALALHRYCASRGWAFLRLDYSGHGASGGVFTDGSIGVWTRDALAVLDTLVLWPVVLVGSSMGAWIMTLVSQARPGKVAGMVGVASAPDFTETLLWNSLTADEQDRFQCEGRWWLPGTEIGEGVEIGWKLIADGRRQRVLGTPLPFSGPVRLLHGLADADVPWQTSLQLADALQAGDVSVTLVKHGDHRLSEPANLELLFRAVEEVREGAGMW